MRQCGQLPESAESCLHALWRLANGVGVFSSSTQLPRANSVVSGGALVPGLAWPAPYLLYYRYGGATTQWAFWVSWPDYDEICLLGRYFTIAFSSHPSCSRVSGLLFESLKLSSFRGDFMLVLDLPFSRDHALLEPRTLK